MESYHAISTSTNDRKVDEDAYRNGSEALGRISPHWILGAEATRFSGWSFLYGVLK